MGKPSGFYPRQPGTTIARSAEPRYDLRLLDSTRSNSALSRFCPAVPRAPRSAASRGSAAYSPRVVDLIFAPRHHDAVLDGEVVCLDAEGRSQSAPPLFRRGDPMFAAFDILWLNGEDQRARSLVLASSSSRKLFPPAANVSCACLAQTRRPASFSTGSRFTASAS